MQKYAYVVLKKLHKGVRYLHLYIKILNDVFVAHLIVY